MRRLCLWVASGAFAIAGAGATAGLPPPALERQAATLAATLAAACPVARYDDEAAFDKCSQQLRTLDLPMAPEIAWGGDQAEKPIKKKGLTHFNPQVFQRMYLPLYGFTGNWSLAEDAHSGIPIIRLEAYFRNRLPAGDYPYPFWHSADKWKAYESSNEIGLYLDQNGMAFVVTRGSAGSEAHRGAYSPATTPAFDGGWVWRDPNGVPEPHVSLFGARYSVGNPYLPELDKSYRTFALRIRDESCLDCHTPSNKAGADRLVLLQSPRHAAGEIEKVIEAVKSGKMPEDDIGLRKDISADRRAAVLGAATAFQDDLIRADRWEAGQSH